MREGEVEMEKLRWREEVREKFKCDGHIIAEEERRLERSE